jgi:hypothetical protein
LSSPDSSQRGVGGRTFLETLAERKNIMKINFEQTLKDMDGKDITEGKEKKVLTLDKVCVNALLSENQDDRQSGEDKLKVFQLAKKIYGAGEVEVTAEEIVLIKNKVGRFYLPLVVGQVYEILEKTPIVPRRTPKKLEE